MSSTPILVSAVISDALLILGDIPVSKQLPLFLSAHAEVCKHVKLYEDDQIPLALTANRQTYSFDPDILRVWSAYWWNGSSSYLQLEEISEDELDQRFKGWRGFSSGTVAQWFQQGSMLGTFPKSASTTTTLAISGATNATPIVVTSAAHGLSGSNDGTFTNAVSISGVVGNTAANGSFYAKVTGYGTTTLALYQDPELTIPVAGNGVYSSGGTLVTTLNYPYVLLYAQKRRVLATTDYMPGMVYNTLAWSLEMCRQWAELKHRDRLADLTGSAHRALNDLSWRIMGRPVRLKPSVTFATPSLRH